MIVIISCSTKQRNISQKRDTGEIPSYRRQEPVLSLVCMSMAIDKNLILIRFSLNRCIPSYGGYIRNCWRVILIKCPNVRWLWLLTSCCGTVILAVENSDKIATQRRIRLRPSKVDQTVVICLWAHSQFLLNFCWKWPSWRLHLSCF